MKDGNDNDLNSVLETAKKLKGLRRLIDQVQLHDLSFYNLKTVFFLPIIYHFEINQTEILIKT